MPKISVVMPTYKVEKYFRECLESVINQTLTDIEIIPVDDGSPDNCGKIMDEYAAKDSRIKPIHKVNGGYGSAVNAGIKAATGEYIGIIETDDFIEPDMYEKLYNQAKKFDADVCKTGFYRYNSTLEDDKKNYKWQDEIQNIEEYPDDRAFKITEYPRLFMFHASIWSNIYKASFLKENNIVVNDSRSASYQDFPFMAECMCKANRIAVVHDYLYHWRVEPNQNSSTNQNGSRLLIMPDQCEEVKRIVRECGCYEELKEAMYKHFHMANWFFHTIKNEYKKEYYYKLKKLFNDIKNDKTFKYKYFYDDDKKFIEEVLTNEYSFFKYFKWKEFRKSIIQFRWNKEEKIIKLFNKILVKKETKPLSQKKSDRINIFVTFHKPYKMVKSNIFTFVHAGRELLKNTNNRDIQWLQKNTIGDNTGENISVKNPNYCELTVQYWAWKNVKSEYIGFFHYRRYLDIFSKYIDNSKHLILNKSCFDENKIYNKIKDFDIVLPKQKMLKGNTVYNHYIETHKNDGLDIIIKIIEENYPDYIEDTQKIMRKNSFCICNMFIAKQELFNEYCEWLFTILEKAEEQIVINNDTYQKRIFGFLAERMLNIFVEHKMRTKNIKVLEVPMVKYIEFNKKRLLEKIFSLKNEYDGDVKYKIITVLWVKITRKWENKNA